ncbi:MAG: DUF1697 domain-containing protein [Actinomycetota bacterium]|nr:DUF1697 domain-containing protein [Actinomycetota bacterium]
MPVYVCLLRGVNVSGHRRVDMKALRALFSGLGHEDVTTYVQSGNVVFTGRKARPATLARAIERQIADELGTEVTAFVLTGEELAAVANANPFVDSGADPATLHVTFLAGEPDEQRVAGLDPASFAPDEFRVRRREVYLRCPNGYGRSKLNNAFWEKKAGVAATTRNWKTVTALRELADRRVQATQADPGVQATQAG